MKSLLEDYTFNVAKKSTTSPKRIDGTCFVVRTVTGATLQVSFDGGNFIPVVAGLKIKLPPGDYFHSITFQNTSVAAACAVSFYAGTVDIDLTKLT
jgi:hypothetical protein